MSDPTGASGPLDRGRRERAERTLLYIKFVDDALAEEGATTVEGTVSGISLRVLARTEADGRPSVAASLYTRVHRMRASGKAFHYWKAEKLTSMARTKRGLVVLRDIDRRTGKSSSTHVFEDTEVRRWIVGLSGQLLQRVYSFSQDRCLEGPAEPDGINAAVRTAVDEISRHLGEVPEWNDRFPLLAQAIGIGPAPTYLPFLDAPDYAQVAKNLFGVRAYRRPLAREVERTGVQTANWFALFRGLVPIDWIIAAMGSAEAAGGYRGARNLTALQRRGIRSILRGTPQPVLRRILKEPVRQAQSALADAANSAAHRLAAKRDLSLLPEIIAARGQRHIRGSRDLEHLVRDLPEIERWYDPRRRASERTMQEEADSLREMERYNGAIRLLPEGTAPAATWDLWKDDAFRQRALGLIEARRLELMEARQRERLEREETRRLERLELEAARHQWAQETAARLDGVEPASGLKVVVATDAATLVRWGAALHNCIGSYAHSLGLDVFAAVCDADGKVRLNLQITEAHGVEQILGTNNRDAVRELGDAAQQVVDALAGLGIRFHPDALGMRGLRLLQVAA